MAMLDRRAVVIGGVAFMVGGIRAQAGANEVDSDPVAEFDGKVKENPKCVAVGRVKATGVVRVPPDHKLVKVIVRWQKDSDLKTGVFHGRDATLVDTNVWPVAWRVEFDNLDAGDYWFDLQVSYTSPAGTNLTADGPEKRRVSVKDK